MKLIVGLGNPGEKYVNTRHNVGFMVVENMAQMINGQPACPAGGWSIDNKSNSLTINYKRSLANDVGQQLAIFSKPLTFMNSSGEAVQKLVNFYHIKMANLWVVHDDLDIKLGQYKIQKGKGPKVHNGTLSIYEKLGTKDFWHVRIGIDNRHSEVVENTSRGPVRCENRYLSGEEYVLQEFEEEEKIILNETIKKVTEDLMKRLFNFQPK